MLYDVDRSQQHHLSSVSHPACNRCVQTLTLYARLSVVVVVVLVVVVIMLAVDSGGCSISCCLCRFIGELYKLRMLTETIMHDCLFKLLRSSDEDSLECLCQLLMTIGQELDNKQSKVRCCYYSHSATTTSTSTVTTTVSRLFELCLVLLHLQHTVLCFHWLSG